MRIAKPLAAMIFLSMLSSPVVAQSAAPLSLAPAGASMDEASALDRSGYILPAIVIFGVLAAAIIFSNHHDDELDTPQSP